ncbi:MAG TPA: sulfate transporter [Treponema sp.]|nr:sulfate transporter [Treponema sp.]
MFIPPSYTKEQALHDIGTGIIIALISIPISMGYASVAGLPAVYGLYGSLLPPALFALCTTSPRFVFGVDAAPAALTGGMLASLGIAAGSTGAEQMVPLITLLTSFWLLLCFLLRADRVLKFISEPVMGGFITGIGLTIICMQVPKLFGGGAGTGEFLELSMHIATEAREKFHLLSFALGIATIGLLLAGKKICPRLPLQPLLMLAGMAATYFLRLSERGVQTLPPVAPGLPRLFLPDIRLLGGQTKGLVLPSLSIAVVILSETLLATSSTARKHGDKLRPRQEIAAYALCNLAAAVSGTCPVNGSVSRSSMAGQFGVHSQVMSLAAAALMVLILLFRTPLIVYLPVPVLTGIVIAALIGTLEFPLARKLHSVDRTEFLIFMAAMLAVLLLGTIYGVITGVLLSAITFIIRQASPAVDFLGIVPGMQGFYSLTRKSSAAVPVKGVIIYRFSGPLFYANIGSFCHDIESAICPDTKTVIADASGIGSIDATATEQLLTLYRTLSAQGLRFYIAGHVSSVNDQLRAFGAQELVHRRAVRARIASALEDTGLTFPYPADENYISKEKKYNTQLAEFEWAFGTEAESIMQKLALAVANDIAASGELDMERIRKMEKEYSDGYWNDVAEDEFLDILAFQIDVLRAEGKIPDTHKAHHIEQKINELHIQLEEKLLARSTEAIQQIVHHRYMLDQQLKSRFPRLSSALELERERYFDQLLMQNSPLAKKIAELIALEEEDQHAAEHDATP